MEVTLNQPDKWCTLQNVIKISVYSSRKAPSTSWLPQQIWKDVFSCWNTVPDVQPCSVPGEPSRHWRERFRPCHWWILLQTNSSMIINTVGWPVRADMGISRAAAMAGVSWSGCKTCLESCLMSSVHQHPPHDQQQRHRDGHHVPQFATNALACVVAKPSEASHTSICSICCPR